MILTSTFHYFFDKRPRQRSWFCKRFKIPSCRMPNLHLLPSVRLIFRSPSFSSAPGSLLGNITAVPHRRGTWQSKDVSVIIKEARDKNHLLITVEFDYGEQYQRYQDQLPSSSLPYLLVYASDLAISEPNSVAVSLQRYDPFIADQQPTQSPDSSPDIRVKRELDLDSSDPIENNELPEVEYNSFKQHDMWESAYFALKPKPFKKERRRKGQEHADGFGKSQVLRFDEKTMKKARRRQWKEPRSCSRRYLKVDFADIGWNEWILSPKSFDAFYCAGTCEFPIPKVREPHASPAYVNVNRLDMLKYLKMTMVNTAFLARGFKQRIPSENVSVQAQLKHTDPMCNYSLIIVCLIGVLSTFWTHFLLK